MATNKELEDIIKQQAEQIRVLSEAIGLGQSAKPAEDVTERGDYIAHGSKEHAAFLGLIPVGENEIEDALGNKFVLFESPTTNQTWRLEDELTISQAFPGIEPDKIVLLVLRQKVSTLEAGKPPIPDHAPPLHVPLPSANY